VKPTAIRCTTESALGDVLARLGDGAADALAAGRIFIGRRRAQTAEDRVPAGTEVVCYDARSAADAPLEILAEADGLVAVMKPHDIATIADHHGRSGTLVAVTAKALGLPEERLFPTSRLDVGVSGVVLFALDDAARAAVARARDESRYARHYVAIAAAPPEPNQGRWAAPIGRDRDPRKRRVNGRDAIPAETAYAVVAAARAGALLAAEPKTGRTHQIRVHAAHAGTPLFGDRAYGGATRIVSPSGGVTAVERIALHAAWIDVALAGGRRLYAEAPVPPDLRALWRAVGGDDSEWTAAVLKLEG
jgi:23S rRNA-/tRNA-specific pseudouridylate synthase